jgi:Tol biopolymer transport system component
VDGTALAYMAITADKGGDILLMKPGSGTPQPLVSSPATEWGGRLSPDGRWIAFVSNTSGRWEAYLQPFPGPASPRRVSSNGGVEVQWARRGRDVELLYRNGRQMVSVPIGSGTGNVIPQPLFEGAYVLGSPGGHNYDVTPDGERFLMIKAVDQESPRRVHVVLNWFNALKRDASAH